MRNEVDHGSRTDWTWSSTLMSTEAIRIAGTQGVVGEIRKWHGRVVRLRKRYFSNQVSLVGQC